jgi:hypothetical protein
MRRHFKENGLGGGVALGGMSNAFTVSVGKPKRGRDHVIDLDIDGG